MGSVYGNRIQISIFGESHGPAIGVVIDGLPAGLPVDLDELEAFLARRAPGRSPYSTSRREADQPEFLSGIRNGYTCGSPVTAIIRNQNTRSSDYEEMRDIPRPGHADYTAHVKFGGYEDVRGGGHFSGRLTAPLCIAGGVLLQNLHRRNITIEAKILSIGGNTEDPFGEIERAKAENDSVGGIIECRIEGVPAGFGEPMFDGLENRIAAAVFGIPAVRGIEFGSGFAAASMRGSAHNDAFHYEEGNVVTETNHHGGILGGISSGMPIVFRVAFKPTPSIGIEQRSIRYSKNEDAALTVSGRHDPCIVPRAVPCVEAAAAIALSDLLLEPEVNNE